MKEKAQKEFKKQYNPFQQQNQTGDDLGSIGERAARNEDGKIYYIPADMTYEEWKSQIINK